LRGVAGVVEHEVLDREVAELLRQESGRVLLGMPTTAVAPVDDAITPIFNWATAEAEASATARASKCESLRFMSVPVRQREWSSARGAADSTERR
jgi:hypothetical protein